MYTTKHLEALQREINKHKLHCMDPYKPRSRPSKEQLTVLKEVSKSMIYLVAGNQFGKSQIGARIIAWKFEENHPYWRRPNKHQCVDKTCDSFNIECTDFAKDEYKCKECGTVWVDWAEEPLTLILAGRVMKQVGELWDKKIKPYLGKEGKDYKVVKAGGALDHVLNLKNGNKILFLTHDKAEQAREKAQGFTAHHVWLDEMPSSHKYIEELQRRIDARMGQFISTFTPKRPNPVIRQMVDNVDPRVGIKFKYGKLDNPIYANRKELEIAKLKGIPEAEQNCILYGDWLDSSDAAFTYNDEILIDKPDNYSNEWAHVFSIDPAAGGKNGYVLIGINPISKKPFVAQAGYIKVDGDLATYVSKISRILNTHNVVRKIYDPAEKWFLNEMHSKKINGWMAADKSDKTRLIINLQNFLESGKIEIDKKLVDLIKELKEAEWDDKPSRYGLIKNSTKYHISDSLQYAVMHLPKVEDSVAGMSYHGRILKAHELQEEAKQSRKRGQKSRYKMLMRKSRKIW